MTNHHNSTSLGLPATTSPPRRGRVAVLRVLCAIALLQALGLLLTAGASADYHVEVCSDLTSGAPSNSSGWTSTQSGSYVGSSMCHGGGYLDVALYPNVTHNYTDNATATFTAPANTAISSFWLWRWDQATAAQAFGAPVDTISYDGNAIDSCAQSLGCPGTEGSMTSQSGSVVGLSGLTAHQIQAQAACGGGPGGVCPSSGAATEVRIYGGDIDLSQSTSPTVNSAGGSLIGAGAHSGTQSVSFSASDNGSGVYSAAVQIDGSTVATSVPNTNGGHCVPTRQNSDGSLVFDYAVPCAASVSGSLSYDTAHLADGSHSIRVLITDAAGNSTPAYDGTITTTNAPSANGSPLIDGGATVGQAITATDTTFQSAASAGSAAVTHSFVRCNAQGANCQPIAGATGSSYTLTAADVGSTIRYRDTAANNDGQTSADSVPSAMVAQPNSGTSSGGGTGTGGNGGTGGTGGSGSGGSGGSTGAGGTGGTGGSGGPGGVTIVLPGGGPVTVALGTPAKWRLNLAVTPRKVHRRTQIKLTGRVLTTPRPPKGKLIYLQARGVSTVWRGRGRKRHRVTAYGAWVTFTTLRANSAGKFAAKYRFKLGGRHRYQFRAVAPQEGGYRNASGNSATVTVTES